jgi:hypothetical protein
MGKKQKTKEEAKSLQENKNQVSSEPNNNTKTKVSIYNFVQFIRFSIGSDLNFTPAQPLSARAASFVLSFAFRNSLLQILTRFRVFAPYERKYALQLLIVFA